MNLDQQPLPRADRQAHLVGDDNSGSQGEQSGTVVGFHGVERGHQ